MSKQDGSVAPKERINIKYVPAASDQGADVELPLKLMVVGDFKGRNEQVALEERAAVQINKENLDAVMSTSDIGLALDVPDRLSVDSGDASLGMTLRFAAMSDFSPDAIARQVPELNQLLELREALVALKGPLGNVPAFRAKLQELLADPLARGELAEELGIVLDAP